VVRRRLGLKTEKRHGNYVIAATEAAKLTRLLEKYGVTTGPGSGGLRGLGGLYAGQGARARRGKPSIAFIGRSRRQENPLGISKSPKSPKSVVAWLTRRREQKNIPASDIPVEL